MAIENIKQITKSNLPTKLIESNGNLQVNDFTGEKGFKKSTVHGKYSRINNTCGDWTKGKGSSAVVTTHNLTPDIMKMIAEMMLMNIITDFTKSDKYTNKIGFFEQKIDHYKKDENSKNKVSMINIRYQEQMNNPWTITFDNGIGEIVTSSIGGVSIKSGSYKSIASVTMYLSKSEMIKK